MQVSFNTYKPFVYQNQNKINNSNQSKSHTSVNFTSGYGADDWGYLDNPDLEDCTASERLRNICKAIKQMTIDAYREAYCSDPPKKPLLFSPEECKKAQRQFYEGTPLEGVDTSNRLPKEDLYKYVFDPYEDDY